MRGFSSDVDLPIECCLVRFSLKDLEKEYAKTEDDIKAVQSVGQIIGEVMKQLDDERCAFYVHTSSQLQN